MERRRAAHHVLSNDASLRSCTPRRCLWLALANEEDLLAATGFHSVLKFSRAGKLDFPTATFNLRCSRVLCSLKLLCWTSVEDNHNCVHFRLNSLVYHPAPTSGAQSARGRPLLVLRRHDHNGVGSGRPRRSSSNSSMLCDLVSSTLLAWLYDRLISVMSGGT
jgi:hypothetical protein